MDSVFETNSDALGKNAVWEIPFDFFPGKRLNEENSGDERKEA
jgi:hypothetical protein